MAIEMDALACETGKPLRQPPGAATAYRGHRFLELIRRMPRIESSFADILLTPFAGVVFLGFNQVVRSIAFFPKMDDILCQISLPSFGCVALSRIK